MKIRSDFVTNSSSSSFIVAYRNLPNIDVETITKYPFLKNYGKLIEKVLFIAGEEDTDAGTVFRTKGEYDEYMVDQYGWSKTPDLQSILDDNERLAERYYRAIDYLSKGFCILHKRVDYNDTYCENMIRELAEDTENFAILEDE